MLKEVFLFIAKELEGVGQVEGDYDTIYGITKHFYPDYFEQLKKSPTEKNIIEIYSKLYLKSKADRLRFPTNFHYFDMSVNGGEDDSIQVLQKSINYIDDAHLKPDGGWGDLTEKAFKKVDKKKLAEVYPIQRRMHYSHKKNKALIHSWKNRCDRLELFLTRLKWD